MSRREPNVFQVGIAAVSLLLLAVFLPAPLHAGKKKDATLAPQNRRRKGLLCRRDATHGLDVGQGRLDLGDADFSLGNGRLHHVPPLLAVRT